MDRWRATLWGSFFDELEKIAGAQGPQVAQNMLRRVSRSGPPQAAMTPAMIPPVPSPPASIGIPRVESTLGSSGRSTLVGSASARPLAPSPIQQGQEAYTMNRLGAGGPPGLSASGPMNAQ